MDMRQPDTSSPPRYPGGSAERRVCPEGTKKDSSASSRLAARMGGPRRNTRPTNNWKGEGGSFGPHGPHGDAGPKGPRGGPSACESAPPRFAISSALQLKTGL
jgi:hypothetical protein